MLLRDAKGTIHGVRETSTFYTMAGFWKFYDSVINELPEDGIKNLTMKWNESIHEIDAAVNNTIPELPKYMKYQREMTESEYDAEMKRQTQAKKFKYFLQRLHRFHLKKFRIASKERQLLYYKKRRMRILGLDPPTPRSKSV
jgi:hypothetical protein